MYQTFRQAGYFIGSGVVEAGCKTVVGQRLKQAGMLWSRQGARQLLSVRCALPSGWFDDFWKHHTPADQTLAFAHQLPNRFALHPYARKDATIPCAFPGANYPVNHDWTIG